MKNRLFKAGPLLTLFAAALPAAIVFADDSVPFIMEGYPPHIKARLEVRNHFMRKLPRNINGTPLEFVFVNELNRWAPGAPIKVAFNGGSADLHKNIAEAAQEWADYGNIKLDFGDAVGGQYRQWSTSDSEYKADIRISFHYSGYWSLVGRDSIDETIVPPGEASLNLSNFHRSQPPDWRAVVLHEFGHALGLQHEHQHPAEGCDRDFRWEDDPGYIPTRDAFGQFIKDSAGRRPGIYTVLGGPPNEWPKAQIDFNLRQLEDSNAFEISGFDARSIMKYYFPAWMFVNGTESHCYSEENSGLSDQDKIGIAQAYPRQEDQLQKLLQQRLRLVDEVLKSKELPTESRENLQEQKEQLQHK